MNTFRTNTAPPRLINEIQSARSRLLRAEHNWKSAEDLWREAKHRRKEVKQAARRARKTARHAEKEFADAKEALVRIEEKFADAVERTARQQKLAHMSFAKKEKVSAKGRKSSRTVRARPARKKVEPKSRGIRALSGNRSGNAKPPTRRRRSKVAHAVSIPKEKLSIVSSPSETHSIKIITTPNNTAVVSSIEQLPPPILPGTDNPRIPAS
jgi:hypothetical protein